MIQVDLDCFPCFLRQALIALRYGTDDVSLQESILKSTLEDIQQADVTEPPAFTTTFIHRRIRRMLGHDPFRKIKEAYNKIALDLLPSLSARVKKSHNPLWTASRLSIAGNVIDFGIFTSIDIEGAVKRALDKDIAVDDFDVFQQSVSETDEILFLADNAGEIVFDRLLIETLVQLRKRVTLVVKGSPVINDSTRKDAEETGVQDICRVIDNGSDAVGTVLEWAPPSFQKTFHSAGLVISKGQANFETLYSQDRGMFFLFQSKCDVLSRALDLPIGSLLLKQHQPAQ